MSTIFWDPKNASNRISVKLICTFEDRILFIRRIWKNEFNLVGGWVDYGESLESAIQREFFEETGIKLVDIKLRLLDVELKHFPKWWQFDGVLNIFYWLKFDEKFTPKLEEWIYEEYKWSPKEELETLPVTEHTNKKILFSVYDFVHW
jgi:8-oxo-dGTP pyrophosphatase MutT (NUDIX family)